MGMIKKYGLLLFFLLIVSCEQKNEKSQQPEQVSVENSKKKELYVKKFETLEEAQKVAQAHQPKRLVEDIINAKNVKHFFRAYGRKNPETKLLLKTRLGNIEITLFKNTPLHRASFIYLIKNGYFNHTCFHRIVKDFIIQAGWSDQEIVEQYRRQLNKYKLPPEFRKEYKHKRGSLSATRRWLNNPDKLSNPFEFYILQTQKDCSHLDFEHTVFGEVTKGFEVIDKIARVPLDSGTEWPEVNVDVEFMILE